MAHRDERTGHVVDTQSLADTCLDTLAERGLDHYGRIHSPIWVLTLDVNTLQSIQHRLDDPIERIRHWRMAQGSRNYSSYVPYGFGYRNIRVSQRPAGCANLYLDQPMIRAAMLNDALNGRSKLREAVDAYVSYYLDHFIDAQTGLIQWGVHTSYNVYDDCVSALDGYWHEIMTILPMWPVLYRISPERTLSFLERFWDWHVDPATGVVGRHNERGDGCNFAMAAAEMILACAFLHTLRPDGPWLERALLVARPHWESRNRETNLFANQLPVGTGMKARFDQENADTSVTGLWASRVLMAGQLTGCQPLSDMGRDVMLAWARYGWDEGANLPYAMLRLDGSPVDEPRVETLGTYDRQAPKGHWNLWKDYVYGFEYPFQTLMSLVMAADQTGENALTEHAKRLGDCYRSALPANHGMGTFAANYGQLISFFLAMEQLTGVADYRATAQTLADEAAGHLWAGRIFRGFPGKDYYEAVDGVGYLVQAFIELSADPEHLVNLRKENLFLWNI